VALLTLLLLLLFGFGGVSSGSSSSSGSGTAQPERAITLADSGRTISMRPGESAVLRLPDRWVWAETTEGSAVDLSVISSLRDTGFSEWSLVAARPGTWTFRAHGEPGGRRFAITIRVR
jgi:hypothetical protein